MEERPSVEVTRVGAGDATRVFLDSSERHEVPLGVLRIGHGVYRPGWRWSRHARPQTGMDSAGHAGYVVSGRMAVRGADGTELIVGPGEAFFAAPGHDAWVVGEEPCVALDFRTE